MRCRGILGRIVVCERSQIGETVNEPRRCGHANNGHDPRGRMGHSGEHECVDAEGGDLQRVRIAGGTLRRRNGSIGIWLPRGRCVRIIVREDGVVRSRLRLIVRPDSIGYSKEPTINQAHVGVRRQAAQGSVEEGGTDRRGAGIVACAVGVIKTRCKEAARGRGSYHALVRGRESDVAGRDESVR